MATYTYNLTDFLNATEVDLNDLQQKIDNDATIVINVNYITRTGNVFDIVMLSALNGTQQTALTTLINNYIYSDSTHPIDNIIRDSIINSSTYTVTSTDITLLKITYTTIGSVTITLPLVSNYNKILNILDEGNNCSQNNIVLNCQTGDTVYGENSLVMSSNGMSITLLPNESTKWLIL